MNACKRGHIIDLPMKGQRLCLRILFLALAIGAEARNELKGKIPIENHLYKASQELQIGSARMAVQTAHHISRCHRRICVPTFQSVVHILQLYFGSICSCKSPIRRDAWLFITSSKAFLPGREPSMIFRGACSALS